MKKKLVLMMSTMLICACVLAGCGQSAGSESNNTGSTGNVESEVVAEFSEEVVSEMVELKENDASDFTYKEVEGQIIITDYNGKTSDVVIPAIIDGKEVVGIGSSAFLNDANVISVICPNTLKEIQENAFLNATNLTNIEFNDGLEIIGKDAFNNSSLQKVIMPDSIVCVGDSAFASGDVTEIKISEAITELPMGCFLWADITTFTVPGHIKKVGHSAFANCENLEKLVFEEGVEKIDTAAFFHCEALTSVVIPASVTEIVGVTASKYAHIVFTVPAGSYAEQYMKDNGLNYVIQ